MRTPWLVAAALVLACADASGQAPPRDARPTTTPATATISGRVLAADTSRPLRRARVSVTAAETGGRPRTGSTGSDGRYEIADLPPGRYRIRVERSGYLSLDYGQRRVLEQGQRLDVAAGDVIKDVDFMMPRMAVITGRVTDELGEPIEGVMVLAKRLRFWEGRRQLVPAGALVRTDDQGRYRVLALTPGAYYVEATIRETWMVREGGTERAMGYAPTYYPGSTAVTGAARVDVGLGQEVPGIDIALIPGRAVSISGTAFDSRGQPFQNVNLRDEVRGENFGSFRSGRSAPVAPNGTFILRNIPAGEYKLEASSGRNTDAAEVAIVTVSVDNADVTDVALLGSPGATVTGRVLTDTGSVPALPNVRIELAPPQAGQADPALLGTFRQPGWSALGTDGTFTIRGVFGRSRFRVTLPDDWMVKTIHQDGRDLTDLPIELRGGETLSGIDIVITDKVSTLSGQLTDQKGVPVLDGTVIVFPDEAGRWGEDSRMTRAVRPDRSGRYQVKGLPAGEYLAVALDYIEDGVWNDPEFLEPLRRSAQKVTISEAGTYDVPLRLVEPDTVIR